jgi:hypothetical protein
MSHLFSDLDRGNSKLDRDYAAQADDHLWSDCRLWNGSASNSISESTTLLPALKTIANEVERSGGKRSVQLLAQCWHHSLGIPELTLSVELGRANRPDLPVRVESRVKSSPGSAGPFSTGLRVGIADWFELLRERKQGRIQVDEALGG